ncbi:MAG: 4-(cytidine 5'-diphospho)-2-C-methyl-D-erythritol kinase [Deltaproteobacteria bacterium]|nr:4-(cytidine 5'-diphospho)-2-C-methyl-D-erythritol kinase [Deltaproteobacteria bacterium]
MGVEGASAFLRAPAKINLFLKVLGRRPDGYHELLSLMARLTLADEIRLEPFAGGRDEFSFDYAGPGQPDPAFVGDNLVLRALQALRAEKPELGFFRVHIQKNIPLAAGLGGGSSDAATILRHLGPLLGLEPGRLRALALALGSDVPFFLGPPLALVRGRGEILSPWPGAVTGELILVNPGIALPTGRVFQKLALTKGQENNNLGPDFRSRPDLLPLGQNDLLAPALDLVPALGEVQATVAGLGSLAFGLSGSGPTFWALFGEAAAARRAWRELETKPWWSVQIGLDLSDRLGADRWPAMDFEPKIDGASSSG